MTQDDPQNFPPEAQAKIRKMRRRHIKEVRKARAEGMMDGICAMLRPGDVVLDCGANMGHVTARLAANGATVHAFEPDPFCFGELQKRFADDRNVILHNCAVAAEDGRMKLFLGTSQDGDKETASVKNTLLHGGRQVDEGQSVEVDVIDLTAFIDNLLAVMPRIAFVKIDIEGAELDLLQKMHDQGKFAQIGLTVAETHEHKFKDLRPRFAELREAISAQYPITKVNLDWI